MIQVKLDKKAKSVIAKTADFSGEGGSSTKVVTELPEVGEEHTIYELQEAGKGSYSWVVYSEQSWHISPFPLMRYLKLFVFDTYEQMVDVLTNITPEIRPKNLIVYTRLDDMLYRCDYRNEWSFNTYNRMTEYEHYVFEIPMGELVGAQYILKSYDGYDEEESCVIGTLPDGTKVNIYSDTGAFVLRQASFDIIYSNIGVSFGTFPSVSELPTVEEGNLTSGGVLNGSSIVNLNGKIKYSLVRTENYYWSYNLNSFRKIGVWEDEGPAYTGELEWTEEMPDNVKEYFFEEYPYEDIINLSIDTNNFCLFQPKQSGEIVSTYWVYTNDKWVNIDEIDTNPSLHKTVFGTLTDTGDQTQLQCSLTLEEMTNAIAEGNCVVLELYLGDGSRGDYWYCAITEVTGMEAPQPTIAATWSLMHGRIYWNRNTGAFGFDNGIM